jgi:hypothetical protein
MQDPIFRFRMSIRFRDTTGLARFPVGASQLPGSRLVVHTYEPQDHFSRQLVIPEIRLSDWEPMEHEQP